MRRYRPVALNADPFSRTAQFGVAELSASSGRWTYLLSPVFRDKYQAEVFIEAYPTLFPDGESTFSEEIDLADELVEFQSRYDSDHDGIVYDTHDGKYPSARVMADRFLAARGRAGSDR